MQLKLPLKNPDAYLRSGLCIMRIRCVVPVMSFMAIWMALTRFNECAAYVAALVLSVRTGTLTHWGEFSRHSLPGESERRDIRISNWLTHYIATDNVGTMSDSNELPAAE